MVDKPKPIQTALRLDPSFNETLKAMADKEERSLHAQVVYILRAWFNADILRKRLSELESQSSN